MDEKPEIRDLIGLWPSRAACAADINAMAKRPFVTEKQVHMWARRGSIPAPYQHWLVLAGQHRGFPVTAERVLLAHSFSKDIVEGTG